MNSQHLLLVQKNLTKAIGRLSERQRFSEAQNRLWSESITENGWEDINLIEGEKSGEIMREYLTRILSLSYEAYRSNNSNYRAAAVLGLKHWYALNPVNWNWWWNDIGKQRLLGATALFLKSLGEEEIIDAIAADMPLKPSMTGANLSDLCHGVAIGALLTCNERRFIEAMRALITTFEQTSEEGIQADFSYQQHGAQIYNGGYGESFYNIAIIWAYACHGSLFQFEPLVNQRLLDYFEQGTMWMTYSGQFDFNVCGRAVAKPSLEKPDYYHTLANHTELLIEMYPQFQYRLSRCKHYFEHRESYPYAGFKYFWRSDYAALVNPDYAVYVKANSCRTEPIEQGNQENLKGGWLGFGSMNISVTGDEYQDVFPVWDWRFVPGVTAPSEVREPTEWGKVEQSTLWAGGVSNGQCGLMTYELDYEGSHGVKSWFFFDGVVVALGSGLKSDSRSPLVTTLNQIHRCDDFYLDGEKTTVNGEWNATWVYHNRCGYISHQLGAINVTSEERCSSWRTINKHLNDEPISNDVLTMTINHGVKPSNASYAYSILPNSDLVKTEKYLSAPKAEVRINRPDLQAVKYKSLHAIVFKQPNQIDLQEGWTLDVDKPCVLLAQRNGRDWHITLATPGESHTVNIQVRNGNLTQSVSIETPDGRDAVGRSVSVRLAFLDS